MQLRAKNLLEWDWFVTVLFVVLLSLSSQAATVMLGDFEGSMDGWNPDSSVTTAFSTQGVTHGASSLQVTFPSGWKNLLTKSMASQLPVLQTMTAFSLDVTTRNDSGQIPGWLSFMFIINSGSTGWLQFNLGYPGVPTSPRTDTLTVTIPQSVRDAFQSGTGGYADFILIANSGSGGTAWFDNIIATVPGSDPGDNVTITVDAAAPVRTIPMTLYGANLASWDGSMGGSNTTFNNLMQASGCKYFRIPGGSWSNGHLWSDIEELYSPYASSAWKVSYNEYLYLMTQLSQPGQEVAPTLQPIVNFPGGWYGYTDPTTGDYITILHGHEAAVDAAVAWVQDQTARATCAEYWEIGNEIGGPWEVGWFDGISGTYYGDYFADFYLGMKAVNPNIKIGACAEPVHKLQEWGWYEGYWDRDLLEAAAAKGVVPDFFIIHQYPGSYQDASYNPTLLSSDINNIGIYTSNMDTIISDTLGSEYVGQIGYYMTEWNAGGYDPDGTENDYDRSRGYINAMFRAQYILEMAKHNWVGSNPWIYDYDGNYRVYPVWYVNPLLINVFGRDMVAATSSHSLVRAYAAEDASGNMTIFVINNSPTDSVTANINISGFTAGTSGQQWLLEPAGSLVANGVNIQDSSDIRINSVFHPDPLAISSLAPQSFTSGNSFNVTLPASSMVLMKITPPNGNTTPPAAPTNLTAALNGLSISLDWNDNTEGDLGGYHIYRSTIPGSDYSRLNATVLADSHYTDTTGVGGQTYYYVVTAVDTVWNESADSSEQSVRIPATAIGGILREWWTGISGGAVSNLTSNTNYPNNPSGRQQISMFEGPVNWAESYGTRIRGYLYPPTTGSYTFWIAGDDNCQLWLSSDGTPSNKAQIAYISGSGWTDSRQWDKFPSQQSAPKALIAGQKYYIEVLHKEYTGGDNIAVAWSGPGISQQVIDGHYLSPWFIGLYGDLDDSGTVSLDDLAEFADTWLRADCMWTSRVDLDGDCLVDLYELAAVARNWLK